LERCAARPGGGLHRGRAGPHLFNKTPYPGATRCAGRRRRRRRQQTRQRRALLRRGEGEGEGPPPVAGASE
jgi:hypothetical protein